MKGGISVFMRIIGIYLTKNTINESMESMRIFFDSLFRYGIVAMQSFFPNR